MKKWEKMSSVEWNALLERLYLRLEKYEIVLDRLRTRRSGMWHGCWRSVCVRA
jgi:hypothetical protein